MICLKCGIDNASIIDCDAEWRFYGCDDNKQDPSRVGLPINPLLKTSSLGTCISGRTNNTIKAKITPASSPKGVFSGILNSLVLLFSFSL